MRDRLARWPALGAAARERIERERRQEDHVARAGLDVTDPCAASGVSAAAAAATLAEPEVPGVVARERVELRRRRIEVQQRVLAQAGVRAGGVERRAARIVEALLRQQRDGACLLRAEGHAAAALLDEGPGPAAEHHVKAAAKEAGALQAALGREADAVVE